MRIIAVVEEGLREQVFYQSYFERIKRETQAEYLIVIMSGEFLHSGFPAEESKESRAQKLIRFGADLILELPVYSVLLRQDSYVAAVTSLLQKIGCVNELILPYQAGKEQLLEDTEKLLFRMPQDFMKRQLSIRKQGFPFIEEVPLAAEEFIPGAYLFLMNPLNRFAVDMKNCMKRSYCMVKAHWFPVEWEEVKPWVSEEIDQILGQMVCNTMNSHTESWLTDIFSGQKTVVQRLKEYCRLHMESFSVIAEQNASHRHDPEHIRKYCIRCLMGLRKIDHSVCALLSFVPALRILAKSENARELVEKIKKNAKVSVVNREDRDVMLQELEDAAQKIYREIKA